MTESESAGKNTPAIKGAPVVKGAPASDEKGGRGPPRPPLRIWIESPAPGPYASCFSGISDETTSIRSSSVSWSSVKKPFEILRTPL